MVKDIIRYLHKHESIDDLFTTCSGKNVSVALLDSGVDATHPALKGKVVSSSAFSVSQHGVTSTDLPIGANDKSGHGTGAAGIISQIAPDANLVDIRVLNAIDAGQFAVMAEGLRCAIARKVQIINMALGVRQEKFIVPLLKLLQEACSHKITVIAASDNKGHLLYPAALPYVISVNLGPSESLKQFFKNSTGLVEFGGYGGAVRTLGLNHSHVRQTGNSFAAAHISGITALLLEKWPGLPLHKTKFILSYYAEQNTLGQAAIRENAYNRIRGLKPGA